MVPHLSDAFLDRVKGGYRLAITAAPRTGGMWAGLDQRRGDIHAALVASDNIRDIFRNPTTTDLYYGVDGLCRSDSGPIDPETFVDAASLQSGRGRTAGYQANRVRQLLAETNSQSILAIGSGMGRMCYHLYRSGLTDCSTIDLPLGIVAQACFLGRVVGPDALWFAGEDEKFAAGRINLLFARPERRYGVAINVDSITEMPDTEVFRYAQWLDTHASLFLSINHAKNRFTVAELMAFAGMTCRLRKPCAMDGYMELGVH